MQRNLHTFLATGKITTALKDEIRRVGLPAEHRADAWWLLSGAASLQQQHAPGTYAVLAASPDSLSDEILFAVEEDVRLARAQFPDCRVLQTAKGAEAHSRVLFAALQHLPAGAYSRQLAPIAALILTVFGREREEQAFWVLQAFLLHRFLPPCYLGQLAQAALGEVATLRELLLERQPHVLGPLGKLAPDALEQLTSGWFGAGFVRTLPRKVRLTVCMS
jgi:hypothetical protein